MKETLSFYKLLSAEQGEIIVYIYLKLYRYLSKDSKPGQFCLQIRVEILKDFGFKC